MDRDEQRRIVEALVLASPEPISAAKLAEHIPYLKPGRAKDLVNELNTFYQENDRSFEIWEVAGGYQLRTRAEFSGYLQKLQRQRPLRLSRAALETLSIVAYKQPATRAEIEDVRGVECGPVLKSLLDRHLLRIAGHRDVPGRPMVYATTRRFLEVFGLDSLKDLPALRELDELAREQGLVPESDADEALEADGEGDEDGAERDLAADVDAGPVIVEPGAAEAAADALDADGTADLDDAFDDDPDAREPEIVVAGRALPRDDDADAFDTDDDAEIDERD